AIACAMPTGRPWRRAMSRTRIWPPCLEVWAPRPQLPPQSHVVVRRMKLPIRLLAAPLFAVPFALGMAAAAPAASQSAISPGYWETITKVTSPFPTQKTERRCITPADVTEFMEGKINHSYTCTYPTKDIGPRSIRLQGTCATRDG